MTPQVKKRMLRAAANLTSEVIEKAGPDTKFAR